MNSFRSLLLILRHYSLWNEAKSSTGNFSASPSPAPSLPVSPWTSFPPFSHPSLPSLQQILLSMPSCGPCHLLFCKTSDLYLLAYTAVKTGSVLLPTIDPFTGNLEAKFLKHTWISSPDLKVKVVLLLPSLASCNPAWQLTVSSSWSQKDIQTSTLLLTHLRVGSFSLTPFAPSAALPHMVFWTRQGLRKCVFHDDVCAVLWMQDFPILPKKC